MSFVIMTDTSSNIPSSKAQQLDIKIIPFYYYIDGKEYSSDGKKFDADEYYKKLGNGMDVKTSQITPQRFESAFEEVLKDGSDIIFISMSSGISSSCGSAKIAAKKLAEKYPERRIKVIDSLGASFGEGILAMEAARMRAEGMDFDEVCEELLDMRSRLYQVFTVDDLMFLKRGGRLSSIAAGIGTILNIKPILKGNRDGKIVAFSKARGRKRSIEALAEKYSELVEKQSAQTIYIAHCGCKQDAHFLAKLINKIKPPKKIAVADYEPVTGSYVGPGALALFFLSHYGACNE